MLFNIYSCRETLDRLEDYLDRELSANEVKKVEQHLKLCRQCTKKFAFEARLLEEMRAKINRIRMPSDLKDRVFHALQQAAETPTSE